MAVLRPKTILNVASVSATGNWYNIDYRADFGGELRSLSGTLTTGDTVYVEMTNQPLYDAANASVAPITVISTIGTFTSTEWNALVEGPMVAIRCRKTGTAGPAIVQALI